MHVTIVAVMVSIRTTSNGDIRRFLPKLRAYRYRAKLRALNSAQVTVREP